MRDVLLASVLLLWLGGVLYCLLSLWAAVRFRASAKRALTCFTPGLSLLKPLCGLERGLERNLETFFQQDYPNYELLFAVNDAADPAQQVLARLQRRYPHVPVTVVEAVAPPYPNAKVYSLEKMAARARWDLLVVSDSDVFVTPQYLRKVAEPFADQAVGVTTCVYRGVAGSSFWSRLEAIAMSTEFMSGVLVAWALEGMKFALGPTMAVRRSCLEAIGGFPAMGEYLADDFVLGQWAAQAGYRVVLSPYVLGHRVLEETFWTNFVHRLRWARSSRFSRPWGYLGQAFTHPVPFALLLLAVAAGSSFPLGVAVPATVALGVLANLAVGWGVLGDRSLLRWCWLIPLQDLFSFAVWLGGFTGRCVRWRGRAFRVWRGGRFEAVAASTGSPRGDY